MIPYYGTHDSRKRINIKSIQEEYKIWVLVAEAYGYVVQFKSYQSAKKQKQVASSTKWGLGKYVALRLMDGWLVDGGWLERQQFSLQSFY